MRELTTRWTVLTIGACLILFAIEFIGSSVNLNERSTRARRPLYIVAEYLTLRKPAGHIFPSSRLTSAASAIYFTYINILFYSPILNLIFEIFI